MLNKEKKKHLGAEIAQIEIQQKGSGSESGHYNSVFDHYKCRVSSIG
jgi:hypothetical protein